jgi:hypothetical protein
MSWFSKSDQPDDRPIEVRHVPGLANELLSEIAPLLAAEGVDLNDPNLDPRDLDRALQSAQEQYNLRLFTPTGVHRDLSLAVLRRFTEAAAGHRAEEAQAVLDAVETEETGTTPAISHLIGVSLGLLDTWYSDRTYRAALASTRIASRRREIRASATEVLSAARRGKAFDSLHDLIVGHGGLALYEGAATVVAASIAAIAKRGRRPVPEVCRELLTSDDAAVSAVPLASNGRQDDEYIDVELLPAEERLVEKFGAWLDQHEQPEAPIVGGQADLLAVLFSTARRVGGDLADPNRVEPLVDALLGFDSVSGSDPDDDSDTDGALIPCLLTVEKYIEFQWDVSPRPQDWDEAYALVASILDEPAFDDDEDPHDLDDPGDLGGLDADAFDELLDARTAVRAVDEGLRRSALAETSVSSAVVPFLDWLGTGRAITPSGFLRLADIEPVAAMLGVRAQGVRKLPKIPFPEFPTDLSVPLDDPEVFYAQSMKDIPVLRAWWSALQHVGIIELTKTRVRPGPRVAAWLAGETPPLELSESLNGFFAARILVQARDDFDLFGTEKLVILLASSLLIDATAPDLDLGLPDFQGSPFGSLMLPRALRKLARLAGLGLLVRGDDGRFTAPEPLRAALLPAALAGLVASGGDDDWLSLFPV